MIIKLIVNDTTDDYLELQLDTGVSIYCKPEYKLLLKSGEYKCAVDLIKGDELDSDTLIFNIADIFDLNVDIRSPLVYRIINRVTGKSYIGETKVGLLKRFRTSSKYDFTHYYRYLNHGGDLYKDMRDAGLENIFVEVLQVCLEGSLYDLEEYYINKFDSHKNGYNKIVKQSHMGAANGKFSKMGTKAANNHHKNGTGWFSEENKKKAKEARRKSGVYDSEKQRAKALVAGRRTVESNRAKGTGFFDPEYRAKLGYMSTLSRFSKRYVKYAKSHNIDINETTFQEYCTLKERSRDYNECLEYINKWLNIV